MNQPSPQQRVPESMGPRELGSYMRGLREHFRLSQQDVSEQLHIRVRYVAAIEEGNYASMPGKVYARGYISTYAEFLGLDPDQVVAQCFPDEPVPSNAAPKTVAERPAMVRSSATNVPSFGLNWKLLAAVGVLIVAVLTAHSLLSRDGTVEEDDSSETVAQVPEALLASVRSSVMPRAQNYECLQGSSELICFFAQGTLLTMDSLRRDDMRRFEAEIADVELNPPAPPAAEVEEPND